MPNETIYEIRLKDVLNSRWSAAFAPLALKACCDETLLTGPIRDQSELYGLVLKIRDRGLQLVSINPVPTPRRVSPFPELTTERLLLREFDLSDAPAVFAILGREDVNEWLETDTLQTIEDAEARILARLRLFKDGLGFRWAITLRENPAQVIGSCGYFSVRRGTQTVEIGFELHPDYWRRGMMSEAMQAILQYSFSAQSLMPVHRIEALVAPANTASCRLLQKFGFEREGVRREFGCWKGRYQDVALYALLNT